MSSCKILRGTLPAMVWSLSLASGWATLANGWVIQPDEAASKDTFNYQFLPTFNFETSGPSFQAVLAAADTNSGHDVHALLQFDLSSVPWTASQLASAWLHLYALDGATVGFPFANPTEASPIFLEARPLLGDWAEAAVNWAHEPAAGAPAGMAAQAGIDRWVAIEITELARAWLDGQQVNYGVVITLAGVVSVEGLEAAGVFASASDSEAWRRPYVELIPTPEPGLASFLTGWLVLAGRGGRRP